jgi:tetratricopeptide (TPR) repeat protein
MIMKSVYILALAAALAATAFPALAGMPADVQTIDCQTHDAAREKADRDLAMAAIELMKTHDLAGLNDSLPTLKTALAHAPDAPARPERCGDTVIVYSDQMSDMLAISGLLAGHEKDTGATKVEQREALPYPLLAFAVGWIAFENKDFAAAHDAYAQGLRNDPNDHAIIMEDTLTLAALQRSPEALAQLDAYLARNPDLPDELMAGALRKRGYVLVELARWDEAEAAYRQSLKLAPDDETAKGELEYIVQTRPSRPAN